MRQAPFQRYKKKLHIEFFEVCICSVQDLIVSSTREFPLSTRRIPSRHCNMAETELEMASTNTKTGSFSEAFEALKKFSGTIMDHCGHLDLASPGFLDLSFRAELLSSPTSFRPICWRGFSHKAWGQETTEESQTKTHKLCLQRQGKDYKAD